MTSEPPMLSVIIATYNRRERLPKCLDALARQTQDPADFEVVIADDGSSDGTAAAIAALRMPYALTCLELGREGKPAAVNAGIEAARGEVCLFIDDDVIASPALVAEHLAAHRAEPMTLGIGALEQSAPPRADPYARAHAVRWNRRYEELRELGVDWADTYGGNFSAPRSALLAIGGFDAELEAIEDLEIGYRLQGEGCVPRYLAAAEALHDDHKSGSRILHDEAGFGGFAAGFAERHPETRARLFGWFGHAGPREALLRQLLLTLRVPASLLVALGRLCPRRGRQLWFDFVARYTFWSAARTAMPKRVWSEMTRGVPVLMYHAFTDLDEEDRFIAKKHAFERQMRLLRALRYRTISVERLARSLAAGEPLPKRTVAITIDDGYRDNFEIAGPILRRFGLGATVFPVSGQLDQVDDREGSAEKFERAMLTFAELREMAAGGFEVGAHTTTHPRLTEIPTAELEGEVAGSRAALEAVLEAPVTTFAYPYGDYGPEAVNAVREAGFDAACTTESRLTRASDDPLRIPRLEIMGSDGIAKFIRKLWLGGF